MINLESFQHKLSSDYILNICFSRRFPYIDGPSFSPYKPFSGIVLTSSQEQRGKSLRICFSSKSQTREPTERRENFAQTINLCLCQTLRQLLIS